MFGAVKPMGYYLPVQHNDETQRSDEVQPPAKKRCESVSKPLRAARILGRRYALTATSFKYLEIGISVGMVSTVEIAIGDNRGTQLRLSYAMWKAFMGKRDSMQYLLDSSILSMWTRGLTAEVCTFNGSKVFKLSLSSNNYLYLMPSTMDYLFNLEHCIDHMHVWLLNNTHIVNNKVRNFVNVLREKNITEICDVAKAAKAIRESDVFDDKSLIDCEILTCALNDIMYNV